MDIKDRLEKLIARPGVENIAITAKSFTELTGHPAPNDVVSFTLAEVKKLLKKCTSCHTFDKGGKNGVGPNQWGLMGSNIARRDDYSYSKALKALKDKKWT